MSGKIGILAHNGADRIFRCIFDALLSMGHKTDVKMELSSGTKTSESCSKPQESAILHGGGSDHTVLRPHKTNTQPRDKSYLTDSPPDEN